MVISISCCAVPCFEFCAQISLSGVCQSQAFQTYLGLRHCQMVVSMVFKMMCILAKVFCLVKHTSPGSLISLFWVDRYFLAEDVLCPITEAGGCVKTFQI